MSMSTDGQGFLVRTALAGVLLWGLGGCQTSPPVSPATPAVTAPEAQAIPAGAHTYEVIGEESLLQIFVYRGGAMARLGHNHVIASHHLEGEVQLTEDRVGSRFEIRVPVAQLTVDEPELREAAGPDFSASVPQSSREGTQRNLLSPALLDVATYPVIRLRATDVVAAGETFEVGVEIAIKDQLRQVRVPVRFSMEDGDLHATGEFPLKQSDLGLKPFSVAMGTLVVLDDMRVHFDLVAR